MTTLRFVDVQIGKQRLGQGDHIDELIDTPEQIDLAEGESIVGVEGYWQHEGFGGHLVTRRAIVWIAVP